MTKGLRKNILRTISGSMGRYIAILLIIMLGVAFFTGLKQSRAVMLATQDRYLQETNFYDLRLLSTIGFDDDTLASVSAVPGVEVAAGGYYADFIWSDDDEEEVLHAVSLTEGVNDPELIAGRMPEAPNECLADSEMFTEDRIGQSIEISDLNSEETKDAFAYSSYTVVGICRSPLYMDFSRGTTSLSNGSVSGFILLPFEGFDTDYYIDVYIRHTGSWESYSDAYNDMTDVFSDEIESVAGLAAEDRFNGIVADAETEIADAEAELEKGRAEGQAELDDAWSELEDARLQLENADTELADAEAELSDGERELADGEAELSAAWEELSDAEQELYAAQTQLNEAKAQLDAGKVPLKEAEAELAEAKAQLDAAKLQLDAGADEISEDWSAWEEALAAGQAEANAAQAELDAAIAEGRSELDAGEAALEELEETYHSAQAALESLYTRQQTLQESIDILTEEDSEGNAIQIAVLEEQAEKLTESIVSSEGALAILSDSLETGRAELAAGSEELESQRAAAQAQLDEGLAQLTAFAEGIEAYHSGLAEYNAGLSEINTGWAEYNAALQQYESGLEEYNVGRRQYEDGLAAYQDGLAEYETGKQEYEDGLAAYQEGLQEYADGKQTYEDGLQEYADGQREFESEIADAEAQIADAKAALNDLEEPTLYVLSRNTNTAYVTFESDSMIVDKVAYVFPIFFFLIAALVCSTTMTRMVDDDRTQIGCLRALGYGRCAILSKYVIYAGSAATIGCVLGYFLGGFLFPLVIWIAYQMLYNIDGFVLVYQPLYLIICLLVSLVCSAGTTCLSCRHTMRSTPADLIRPETPAAGKRIFLERIPFFWKKLRFLYKVTLRNIFRFKRRMFMMLIGIAGCTALVLTGFGIRDSVANIGNYQFDDIMRYDISVNTDAPLSEEDRQKLIEACGDAPEAGASAMMFSGDLTGGNITKTVYYVASDDENFSDIFDLHLKGESVPIPDTGQVLLSEKLASQTGVKTGDIVTLTAADDTRGTAIVAGTVENYVQSYVYMSGATYEQVFSDDYEPETLFFRLNSDADEYAVAASLSNTEGVTSVSVITDTRNMIDSMMTSLNYVVALVLASAAALAFIVMFNLGNINISERQREIATLKVLGFHAGETGSYVFRENLILSICGMIIGLPVGILLHRFVMSQIKIDMVTFKVSVKPLSYLFTLALVLIFTWVTDFILRRKIRHIDMAESLKSVE